MLHNNGPETEIGYRLAWGRTYLKGMGLLTNSTRGVWALTDEGTALVTDPSATDAQRRERYPHRRISYKYSQPLPTPFLGQQMPERGPRRTRVPGNRAGPWQAAQDGGIPEGEPGDPHR